MRIQIAKGDLQAALQLVSSSVSSTGTDITTHVVFRAKGGKAEALTFSGRVFASAPLICQVEVDEDDNAIRAFTVESKRLKAWLSAVGDEALTLNTNDGKIVDAASKRGTVKFQSLDPSKFPYWDKTLAKSEVTSRINGNRLHSILSYAKLFVADEKAGTPALTVAESRDGRMFSTDKVGVSYIECDALKGTNIRVHGKDFSSVLSFLSTFSDEEEVEILESSRHLYLRRGDGATFGVARFSAEFPLLKLPDANTQEPHWWVIPKSEILTGIKFLSSASKEDDKTVRFSRDEDGVVQMHMRASSGDEMTIDLSIVDSGSDADADPLPSRGFTLHFPTLVNIVSAFEDDNVRMGIMSKGKGGFVRWHEQRGLDGYSTIHAWLPG